MARRQSKEQKETIERVMHEFKHGELRIRGTGPKVKNPKQAIAIALHEAGATNPEGPEQNRGTLARTRHEARASNQESAKQNRANVRRTRAKERRGETARVDAEGGRGGGVAPTKP